MKTIIFDFDGTIADSFLVTIEIAHKLTGHEALAGAGERNELRRLNMVEEVRKLKIPGYKLPFLLYRGRRMMTARLGDIAIFPGVKEALKQLDEDGYRLFIMSSNSTKNINKYLQLHDIKASFKKVYGGVGLFGKARALRRIMRLNRLKSDDIIYVGDEVRDIHAAKQVTVPCVAVSWGFNDRQLLARASPMAVVSDGQQLVRILERWETR